MPAIAIIGMACEFPEATSPLELWQNVLAQRQAFRRIPAERLNLDDYFSSDRRNTDLTYASEAALVAGYAFDRVKFRVSGDTFRAADLVHWLALDIADRALADAGFAAGQGLPHATTGVLLGNTLTGEFSRANVMRLRWPYVRRVVDAELAKTNWTEQQRASFLLDLEQQYKNPFPNIGEETLAGNLSNTISGRICNHFNLKGGGYTVDGACSSSILALAQACTALTMGDLDVAIAGGVDLSLDPFELVGFARAGALADAEMRVYDDRSAGFWPGEGCGLVVLMREEEAIAQNRRIYAVIRGWGISSDGSGGLTRPEVAGQQLALDRAYRRAGFSIDTVAYFEGHGTGTAVGDTTELKALSAARRTANDQAPPAVVSSIKTNIGHTKAAAGIAGLIKAAMALHTQVLPPIAGCERPHAELTGQTPALRVLPQAELWPPQAMLRAGVSGMGFGGINAHLVLENDRAARRQSFSAAELALAASPQDAEILLLAARDSVQLRQQAAHLLTIAPRLSRSELTDLAAQLASTLSLEPVRAALVAATPKELTVQLERLITEFDQGVSQQLNGRAGIFWGQVASPPQIGFLFPGQGSPTSLDGGLWSRRFGMVRSIYERAQLPESGDLRATEIAQPAIVTASLGSLRILKKLGIKAEVAVGHSLGELTALHWAGALDEDGLLQLAKVRGEAMATLGSATGAMASIQAPATLVQTLLNDLASPPDNQAVVAGFNSPQQTVISGPAEIVESMVTKAAATGLKALQLPVFHGFHSPLVAAAVRPLQDYLSGQSYRSLQGRMVSTVTGTQLSPNADLRSLLCQQITAPVQFISAITEAAVGLDLLIEVGPGRVLEGLTRDCLDIPVVSVDAGKNSVRGLLQAVGAAFVLGAPVNTQVLFEDRFTRPFNLDWQPQFFVNPCELAPISMLERSDAHSPAVQADPDRVAGISATAPAQRQTQSSLALIRQIVAEKTELPIAAVKDADRLLSDLHLNSISVSQIIVEASRSLGLAPPVAPTHYADASLLEVSQALEQLSELGDGVESDAQQTSPSGLDAWVRAFETKQIEQPLLDDCPLPAGEANVSEQLWQIFAPAQYPLMEALQAALQNCPGRGVMVCLPPGSDRQSMPDPEAIALLWQGARAALLAPDVTRFALVLSGGGGTSVAKTLHLEAARLTTCVVNIPLELPQAVHLIGAELRAARGYTEVSYDRVGRRYTPVLSLLPLQSPAAMPLNREDVLLVTGGGKGIAAECAIAVAQTTGVRLAVMGRSQPATDSELAHNLARMVAKGIQVLYVAADVTDGESVKMAIAQVESNLGAVTGILHGAGLNVPKLLTTLEPVDFQQTLAPKVQGFDHLLAALDPDQLKLLVTFGSIIARIGLPGEADYALANEQLGLLVEQFQQQHPACRCLNLEWSIWSGVGMGERLGRMDVLMRQGISAITPDLGIAVLQKLLTQSLPQTSVVVTSRFGEPPTLKQAQVQLPFHRFLEQPRVYCRGVELVADVALSIESDPYLQDHVLRGESVFPAVMGLEAMAQVAMALAETEEAPIFEEVRFKQPIVLPAHGPLKMRVVALVQAPGQISVAIRSEQTAFLVNHFEATCYFGLPQTGIGHLSDHFSDLQQDSRPIPLNPSQDLYGDLLFHGKRFQCLRNYRQLSAKECFAEIVSHVHEPWFSRYLPAELALGDPALRDAVIHSLQACIPHATVLPIGVERLIPGVGESPHGYFVHGQERCQEGDRFVYDVKVIGRDGTILETWQGLHLHIVQHRDPQARWVMPLLSPYLERRMAHFFPELDISIVVNQATSIKTGINERQMHSNEAIQQILGKSVQCWRRPDGKPEVAGEQYVSTAHSGELTLAVASSQMIGCDLEFVVARSGATWRDLLGPERFALAQMLSQENAEELDIAATRVWCAMECLKKTGQLTNVILVLDFLNKDGCVNFTGGDLLISSLLLSINDCSEVAVVAIAATAKTKLLISTGALP